MTKNGFISKFTGLCLILFVLSAHMFGSINASPQLEIQKSKAEKNHKKEDKKEQSESIYSTLDHVVVVPSHVFNFDQIVFSAPSHTLCVVDKCILYFKNCSILIINSFFENIFEVLIAINAP